MPPKPYASIFSITSQPPENIVKAMRALCHDDKFREQAYMYLGKLSRHEKQLKEQNAKNSTAAGVKRNHKTMIDVEICIQCNQPFHEDNNDKKSCFYHPDEMEEDLDSDVWVDWDERCHGPIDTEINRKSFPDGFMYACCEKDGTSKGCTWGEHKVAQDPEHIQKAYIDRLIASADAMPSKSTTSNTNALKSGESVEIGAKADEGGSSAKKRKLDSEEKENQPQEVIEISDDE
ncbi:hypothetical protein V8F20_007996 [Naviculisporaceae sp. PSN 640]